MDYYITCPDGSQKLSAHGLAETNRDRAERGLSPIEEAYYENALKDALTEKVGMKLKYTPDQARKIAQEAKANFLSESCDAVTTPVIVAPIAPISPKKWATVATGPGLVKRGGKRKTKLTKARKTRRVRR
jgi:hypothetical protein